MNLRSPIVPLLLLALSAAGATRAQTVGMAPSPGALTGHPGASVTMHVTLTNTTDPGLHLPQVYLNGDQGSVNTLTLDDTKFMLSVPLTLAQGAIWSGDIFDVLIAPGTPAGIYQGSFTVLGGASAQDLNVLGTQDFSVTVSAVPEPGALALFLPALAAPGFLLRRRKRA